MRGAPRLLRVLPWLGLSLGVLVFYWIEASLRKGPWVFSDEMEWTQLSRSIASTGHAARRTVPHSFESIYSYLIAPAWWFHSTHTAYAAIKYIDATVMCLTAVPVYFLAHRLVSRRAAVVVALLSIAIPAMTYATTIVPESLEYLWFALASLAAVRALTAPTIRSAIPAVALAAVGPFVRAEFIVLPAALVLAAAIVWVVRPRATRHRWRPIATAVGGLALFGYLFNLLVVSHEQNWNSGQYLNHNTLAQGGVAAGAFAVGLGIGPAIGGLASLYLPDRVADPAYRAFVAYLGAAVLASWVYTAAKATYLLTTDQNLIEERNLFFLSPLLLLGTALVLEAKRVNWILVVAATVLVLVLAWPDRLIQGAPYYEAPGLAVPTLLNRTVAFTHADLHRLLVGMALVTIALVAVRRLRAVGFLAAVLAAAWLLTGEIYETKTDSDYASTFAGSVAAPATWVDAITHGAPTTFVGVGLVRGAANPVWLTEFWNRSIDHVYAIDDSAPPPGPVEAPYMLSTDGALAEYTGDRYTVTSPGVVLDAKPLATHDTAAGWYTLYSTPTPWRLLHAERNVDSDGWAVNPFEYTYFPPGGPGVLTIELSRSGNSGPGQPGVATIRVGTVKLDRNQDPVLAHAYAVRRVDVVDGRKKPVVVRIHVPSTPVTVSVSVTHTVTAVNDPRQLAAQPSFSFTRDR